MKEVTIEPKKKDQHALHFVAGGLHASTHTPIGEKIPHSKRMAALAGHYGDKAKKQAEFAKNVLKH